MYQGPMNSKPKSAVSQQIDENLKRIYEDTLKEDVPDRFAELLSKLRAKSDAADKGGQGDV